MAYNKALCERPCTADGCKGTMTLAVKEPKHTTVWYCNKCYKMQPKLRRDWVPPTAVAPTEG